MLQSVHSGARPAAEPVAVKRLQVTPTSSGAPLLRFAGDAVDLQPKPPASLLALSESQQALIGSIRQAIAEGLSGEAAVDYVQRLDENRRPPLEMLKTMVAKGLTVVSVPVPKKGAHPRLIQDADFRKAWEPLLLPEAAQAMQGFADSADSLSPLVDRLGQEGHAMTQTVAAVEMAKQLGVGVTTFLGVNSGLAAEAISKLGTPEQQAFWLNAMADGRLTFAFGLTEEKVGSDPRSMHTTYRRETDPRTGQTVYRLNGNKKFIGNAARVVGPDGRVIHRGADFIVVFAVDDPNKPPEAKNFRAFMVPRTLIGEENIQHTGGANNKQGLREVNNGTLQLKDVVIPESLMLGETESEVLSRLSTGSPEFAELGIRRMLGEKDLLARLQEPRFDKLNQRLQAEMDIYPKLLKMLDETRLLVGAMALGTTEAILETAKQYAAERVQNGHTIQDFQAVRFPLEELSAEALVGRLLILNTARKVDEIVKQGDRSEKFRTDTAMSKLFCSELAERAAQRARKTLGGNGYLEETKYGRGIPKRERDANVLAIYEGTSEIQRNLIAQGVMITETKRLPGPRALKAVKLQQDKMKSAMIMRFAANREAETVIEAAYRYAVADNMLRYNEQRSRLQAAWKQGEMPVAYQGWDVPSQKRQLMLDATLPMQKRLHIMAELATNRHLAQLARQELDVLAQKGRKTPQEVQNERLLNLFLQIAKERAMTLYHELKGNKLKALEDAQ